MIEESLQMILAPISSFPYIALFVGMVVAGEVVLLPAIYLAATGRLDMASVFVIAFVATMISDALWYALGRFLPPERWKRFAGARVGRAVQRLEPVFEQRRGEIVLFLSKFVYGTRTAVQVLVGVHGLSVARWALINTLAILVLNASLVALGYMVRGTMIRMDSLVDSLELAFLVFIIIAVTVTFSINRLLARRLFQPSSRR